MGWLIIKRIFLCLVVLIVFTSLVSATNKNQTHPASQILNETFDYGSFIFRDNVSADYFRGNGSELIDMNRSVIVNELKDNRSSNILFNKNITVDDTGVMDFIKSLANSFVTFFDDVVINENLNVTNINVTVINTTYIQADAYFNVSIYNATYDLFNTTYNTTTQIETVCNNSFDVNILENRSKNVTFEDNVSIGGDLDVTGSLNYPVVYCEASDLADQVFTTAGNQYGINITTTDEGNGIDMNTAGNGTNISILTSGVYHMVLQPQVKAGAGDAGDFHMWLEKDTGTGNFSHIAHSNIELKLSSLEEDVIVLATTLKLNVGDVVRAVASVSDNGILLHTQSPVGEPVIPSIIFTMYRVGS